MEKYTVLYADGSIGQIDNKKQRSADAAAFFVAGLGLKTPEFTPVAIITIKCKPN